MFPKNINGIKYSIFPFLNEFVTYFMLQKLCNIGGSYHYQLSLFYRSSGQSPVMSRINESKTKSDANENSICELEEADILAHFALLRERASISEI
jgi:hypothetical protein